MKFKDEYGELVIACDDRKFWRRDIFPYYKANRKKSRAKSELNWTQIFDALHKIRDELKMFFPYRVVQVDGAEADDIIGSLVMKYGDTSEKILVLSGDKDFVQLQRYNNVKQFDPVQKKFRTTNDPDRFIKEHIMRGDIGDGIPNFLSSDNCLVVGERQKPVASKKLDVWVNQKPEEFCDERMLRGYRRNQQLVDLTFIPQNIQDDIIVEYEAQAGKDRKNLFNYFIEKKLKNLIESINEF
jgi:hypothetical protein